MSRRELIKNFLSVFSFTVTTASLYQVMQTIYDNKLKTMLENQLIEGGRAKEQIEKLILDNSISEEIIKQLLLEVQKTNYNLQETFNKLEKLNVLIKPGNQTLNDVKETAHDVFAKSIEEGKTQVNNLQEIVEKYISSKSGVGLGRSPTNFNPTNILLPCRRLG